MLWSEAEGPAVGSVKHIVNLQPSYKGQIKAGGKNINSLWDTAEGSR